MVNLELFIFSDRYIFKFISGAFFSITLYSLVFLVLQGMLQIKGQFRLNFRSRRQWRFTSESDEYNRFLGVVAESMLW